MKVYISADIEGVAGIAHWDEASKASGDHREYADYMTEEVAAACAGAIAAGATEIQVKDAHASGRNIVAARLPEETRLIRGWSGHPFSMMQEIDDSFAAAALIGYHAPASSDANPLAHTLSLKFSKLVLNGALVSEFMLSVYSAAYVGVPVVFLSGDAGICKIAKDFLPGIHTVATGSGVGESTTGIHPGLACKRIEADLAEALGGDLAALPPMPASFELEIRFRKPSNAYRASFYPGATLRSPDCLTFETSDFFDIMRLLLFV